MTIKNKLASLRENHARLTEMEGRLNSTRNLLQVELSDIATRLGGMAKERADRLSEFIEGRSEAYNPGDEIEYTGLMSVMNLRRKEIAPALEKIESDIKQIQEEKGLVKMAITRVESEAWLTILDEELPQIKDTLERALSILDQVKIFNNVPSYNACPTLHRLQTYLTDRGVKTESVDFERHRASINKRFIEKHGISAEA